MFPQMGIECAFLAGVARVFETRYCRHLLGRPINITHETATEAGKEIGGFIRVIQ